MFSKERQKFVKSLHNKKNRQIEGLFLVEWGKSLEEVLLSDFEIVDLFITEKFNPDSNIIKLDIKTNVNKENFCLVLFFKKADRIAIIKSSLLEAITFNIQSA